MEDDNLGHVVVAYMKLGQQQAVGDQEEVLIKLREGAYVKLTFEAEGVDEEQRISTFTIPRATGPLLSNISFIVEGTSTKYFTIQKLVSSGSPK